MSLLNKACFIGGSAVIIVAVGGGIDLGKKNLPPGGEEEYATTSAGGTSSPPKPAATPYNTNSTSGLPPGAPGDGNTPWVDSASQFIGTQEVGTNGGAWVDSLNAASGTTSGQPWCASFVNYTLGLNGIQGTGSASSQSFRNWGIDAGGPVTGAIVVFSNGDGTGHVGYVHSVNSNGTINVLGGNQSNGVKISTFGTSKVVGYRLPPGYSGGGVQSGNGGGGADTDGTR